MTSLDSPPVEQLLRTLEDWLIQSSAHESADWSDRAGNPENPENKVVTFVDGADKCPEDINDRADLYSVFQELAELKTELRNMTRQNNKMMEVIQEERQRFLEQINVLHSRMEQQQVHASVNERKIVRGFLLHLLDLFDRLQAAVRFKPAVVKWSVWSFLLRRTEVVDWRTGTTMTLNRLEDLLKHYGVRSISSVGLPLNPECMRAVGVESDRLQEEGIVLREIRTGFYWDLEVLRVAEVIVNRWGSVPETPSVATV